ncbi:MAG: YjjG family noncanonical pyrimidine nucleotidase [Bacteroidales bacterium]|jgi:putative hydrolase of the HAD superfamily|nr:YjjG family noncanonical pyrimidine nucleotidase [Bacteroidales bacterium]MDD2425070.1 YjjG family noncanonical pyrimidine nucleotidase [Bacteroidales bacterium]MDD3988621.1 YjjG family noncanonical pyrimidine nucleotidase [Bacteroidales bacterium]
MIQKHPARSIRYYNYFLFDLDRTLWDFDTNAKNNITGLLHLYNLPLKESESFYNDYHTINQKLWADYERGLLEKERLKSERFHRTLLKYGIDNPSLAEQFGREYLERMPLQKALMPYALEVLEHLYSMGADMVIVSNGFKEVQYTKIENSGIGKFFKSVIISEEQGVNKPSPLIFRKALSSINGVKEEAIMVGDDFVNDIEGAMIFGIDQFFYNYRSLPCDGVPTYNSSDLRDLLSLVTPRQ